MEDYFQKGKKKTQSFFDLHSSFKIKKGGDKRGVNRKIEILALINLVIFSGLFFSYILGPDARAENREKVFASTDLLNLEALIEGDFSLQKNKCLRGVSNIYSDCLGETQEERIALNREAKGELYQKRIQEMTAGHPIEKMTPAISKQDPKTAAFLVAIAKKESNWGVYSPKKNGKDCFNYWGYKGGYNPVAGGYSCFDSPEQAVETVGKKISKLVEKRIDTPEKMLVWKCGSSCAGHDPAGVSKWVSDVRKYWSLLN